MKISQKKQQKFWEDLIQIHKKILATSLKNDCSYKK